MSDFSGGGHDGNNIATTTTTAKPTTWQTTAEMKERAFGSGNARQATTIVGIYGPGGIGNKKIHCFSSSHCSLLVFMLHMAFLISWFHRRQIYRLFIGSGYCKTIWVCHCYQSDDTFVTCLSFLCTKAMCHRSSLIPGQIHLMEVSFAPCHRSFSRYCLNLRKRPSCSQNISYHPLAPNLATFTSWSIWYLSFDPCCIPTMTRNPLWEKVLTMMDKRIALKHEYDSKTCLWRSFVPLAIGTSWHWYVLCDYKCQVVAIYIWHAIWSIRLCSFSMTCILQVNLCASYTQSAGE